jgi:iron complex outermembrane receptor protein
MHMSFKRAQAASVLIAVLLPPAEAAAESGSDRAADPARLDRIEVTAGKRVQSLAEVPVSVQVVDGAAIEQQALKDTSALGTQAVNVKITQNTAEGTAPAISIRGVGNLDYNTSTTSPIGVYVDGVGGGTGNHQLVNLYDIDSVEILRGPQGTLFGRNTSGGALLINTRQPEPYRGGYLSAGLGEHDLYRLGGALNLPVDAQTALRLAFDHRQHGYSIDNLHAPAPQPERRHDAARLSLLAERGPLKLQAKIEGSRWDGVAKPVRHIGVYESLGKPASGELPVLCPPSAAGSTRCTDVFGFNVGSNDLSEVRVNSEAFSGSPSDSDYRGADLRLDYTLDASSYLVAVSGFRDLERVHHYNADASPARITEGSLQADSRVFSQELRYHREQGPAYLIAGLYIERESLSQDFFIDLLRDFRAAPEGFSSAALFLYDNAIDPRSDAAFANLDYRLGAQTTLTAGLRYTRDRTDYRALGKVNVATAAGDFEGLTVPAWDVAGRVEDQHVSGKLALNRQWSPRANSWISFARGHKSGGYNGAIAFSAEEAQRNDYGSEVLDALEIGGSLVSESRALRLQYGLFHYDYRDQQVFMNTPSVTPGAPPLQLLDNVGESKLYGGEIELDWRLSDSIDVRFGLGWLPEAELREFVNAAGDTVRGNRLPFTSEWNANLFLDWRRPLGAGELLVQLNGDYQSEFYFDQNQNPYVMQGGYTLWNTRLAYEQGGWTAALWVKNLGDVEYSHLRFDLIGFLGLVQDHRGDGRQVGADLTYRF